MKTKQTNGTIIGGQVYIVGKTIKNNGKIISSGKGAKTHIETESYSGTGSVESHTQIVRKEVWFKKYLKELIIGIAITVIGSLVLYYLFGIK